MPPKVAAPPVVERKGLEITISISQTVIGEYVEFENLENYRVRVISEWIDCCGTTGLFGANGSELPWVDVEDTAPVADTLTSEVRRVRRATFKRSFDPFFVERDTAQKQKLNNFNLKPEIYFIALVDVIENNSLKSVPKRFIPVDCSTFLIEKSTKLSSMDLSPGVEMKISIEIDKPLLPYPEAIQFEPLCLNFQRCNIY